MYGDVPLLAKVTERIVSGILVPHKICDALIVPPFTVPDTVTITAVLVAETQPVVVFLDSAKYVVVVLILGVVNEVTPVPPDNTEPPEEAAYQSIVLPETAVAERLTVPEPVRDPFTGLVGANGKAFMVMVITLL